MDLGSQELLLDLLLDHYWCPENQAALQTELHWLVCSVMLMGLLTGWPVCQVPEDKKLPSDLPPTPVLKLSHGAVPAHGSPLPCRGSPMWYTGVVPALTAPSFPETIPAGALDALPWLTVLTGAVLRLIGTGPDIFSGSDLLRSLLKPSQLSSVDLSQITATSLSVCPSPSGSLGLRYHVKTRERRGSSFSQLGLEPNHTGLTAQSLFFLEESCRVKHSDTQTFSNFSNYFKRKLQKRSSSSPNKTSSAQTHK